LDLRYAGGPVMVVTHLRCQNTVGVLLALLRMAPSQMLKQSTAAVCWTMLLVDVCSNGVAKGDEFFSDEI
jgi:hypothetical protein